jgi:hypothetical protein
MLRTPLLAMANDSQHCSVEPEVSAGGGDSDAELDFDEVG